MSQTNEITVKEWLDLYEGPAVLLSDCLLRKYWNFRRAIRTTKQQLWI